MRKITTFKAAVVAAIFGFSTANAQYCEPTQLDCFDGDVITNVSFSGINNPSDCDGGYSDYTETVDPAQVNAGEFYEMAVTVGGGWANETVGVWIDFDNNETFDADEFYLIGTGTASTVIENILIPEDVESGIYRMRVSVIASNLPFDDPCFADFNYGEMEDYLVEVGGSVNVDEFAFAEDLMVFKNNNNVVVDASATGLNLNSVQIFDITGKQVVEMNNLNVAQTTINLNAGSQMLLIRVESIDGKTAVRKLIF